MPLGGQKNIHPSLQLKGNWNILSHDKIRMNLPALDSVIRMWKMSGLIPSCFCQVFNYTECAVNNGRSGVQGNASNNSQHFVYVQDPLNIWMCEQMSGYKKTADHVIIIIHWALEATITLPSSWAVATVTISLYKYVLIALPLTPSCGQEEKEKGQQKEISSPPTLPIVTGHGRCELWNC